MPTPTPAPPALALVELSSIARGVVVADAMVKKAPVRIVQTRPISPGKHLIVVDGEVAEVDEALAAGLAAGAGTVVDRLFLPNAHAALASLLAGHTSKPPGGRHDAVAVFESYSVSAAVLAADAAAKAADVTLLELRLGMHIGGKGVFTLTGELHSVEAAIEAARAAVEPALVFEVQIVAFPHADLATRLFW
jgi:microcompartment protein CcmL/EutN